MGRIDSLKQKLVRSGSNSLLIGQLRMGVICTCNASVVHEATFVQIESFILRSAAETMSHETSQTCGVVQFTSSSCLSCKLLF